MSTLWLLPAGSVHVGTIAAMMYTNMFVGAFGHCRLDFNLGFFNTRFHAGHHALSNCNFAQNVEIWDRIFGTFRLVLSSVLYFTSAYLPTCFV